MKKRDCQPVELSPNETSAATTMPTGKNAKNPMIIVNVKFNECVKFTLYASNSHVNDIHWDLTLINASNSRIAFKRTETARQGVFPSNGCGHIKTLSKRLESAFKRQQRAFKRQQATGNSQKTLNRHYL